jgi:hypothetical protein
VAARAAWNIGGQVRVCVASRLKYKAVKCDVPVPFLPCRRTRLNGTHHE